MFNNADYYKDEYKNAKYRPLPLVWTDGQKFQLVWQMYTNTNHDGVMWSDLFTSQEAFETYKTRKVADKYKHDITMSTEGVWSVSNDITNMPTGKEDMDTRFFEFKLYDSETGQVADKDYWLRYAGLGGYDEGGAILKNGGQKSNEILMLNSQRNVTLVGEGNKWFTNPHKYGTGDTKTDQEVNGFGGVMFGAMVHATSHFKGVMLHGYNVDLLFQDQFEFYNMTSTGGKLYDLEYKGHSKKDISNKGSKVDVSLTTPYKWDRKFQAEPKPGYRIKSITNNGKNVNYSEDGTFTFKKVTEDINLNVEFEKLPEATWNITKKSTNEFIRLDDTVHYVIEGTATPGEVKAKRIEDTLSQFGLQLVDGSVKTTVTGENARIDIITQDKDNLVFDLVNSETEASTFKVEFDTTLIQDFNFENGQVHNSILGDINDLKPIVHKITTTVNNGTITPSNDKVRKNSDFTTTYTPNEGYELTSLTVDGNPIEDITKFMTEYIFKKVTEDHTIHADFTKKKFTITTNTDGNGEITPTSEVEYGDDKVITFTPNDGYELYEVNVDGTPVEKNGNSYTFTNIKDNHNIIVKFAKIPDLKVEKTATEENVQAGELAHYTIKVNEQSDDPLTVARNVILSDKLDSDMAELIADSIKVEGTDNFTIEETTANSFKIKFTELTAKNNVVVTYDVKVKKEAKALNDITNTATITAENNPKVNTSNSKINSIIPDFTITKIADKDKAIVGDILKYTIKAENIVKGTVAKDVVIKDVLPKGLELASEITTTAGTVNYNKDTREITVEIPTLETNVEVKYDAKVVSLFGILENIASIKDGEFMEYPKQAKHITEVIPAKINFNKLVNKETADRGDKLNYTLTAELDESGANKAVNVIIKDKLPTNAKFDEKSFKTNLKDYKVDFVKDENGNVTDFTITIPELTEKAEFTYSVNTNDAEFSSEVINEVKLTFDNDGNDTYKNKEIEKKVITKINDLPDTVLKKVITNDGEFKTIGDYIEYKISVSNGNKYMKDIVLTDTLPAGLKLDKDSVKLDTDDKYEVSIKDNQLIITIPNMTKDFNVTYKAKITDFGVYKNIATLNIPNFPEITTDATVKLDKPVEKKTPTTGDENNLFALSLVLLLSTGGLVLARKK